MRLSVGASTQPTRVTGASTVALVGWLRTVGDGIDPTGATSWLLRLLATAARERASSVYVCVCSEGAWKPDLLRNKLVSGQRREMR
jgi:hypothetical protein